MHFSGFATKKANNLLAFLKLSRNLRDNLARMRTKSYSYLTMFFAPPGVKNRSLLCSWSIADSKGR